MVLSSALQWWEEWQLHVLVLSSLGVQCYLAFFASARRSHIRPMYRFSIWLAYLGGDALAIYALATLFNRQKKIQYKTGSHDLELLWAPVLLMHLGGPLGISAYNIEDNELWRRHILSTVSQVAVGLYIFCKSWSPLTDKRLLAVAILLFITGALKCFEKPMALKRASFNSLVSSFHPAPITTMNREVELEEYIQAARDFVNRNEYPPPLDKDGQLPHLKYLSAPDKLFVDSAYAYRDHLTKLKSFWLLDDDASYEALCRGLSKIFEITYTKIWHYDDEENRKVSEWGSLCSDLICLLNIILSIVPIVLFHGCSKEAYRKTDIKVTFILLYITSLLEFASLASFIISGVSWHDKVAQHNLIGFLAYNKRHKKLMGIAQCLQCKGLIGQYFCLKPSCSCKDITKLVRGHVKDGWTNYIHDVESYWKFTDMRGHWTLKRNGCEETLQDSIEKPFDESILLWHVATDFCFHHESTSSKIASLCRDISNYMIHLLFANPEMLMPGSRRILFTDAYNELEAILQGNVDISSLDEKELTKQIVDEVESEKGFIHEAWFLSQELMQLGDQKMWEVIKGVWIEMLCFSAGRCRGYLHAKSIGSGGEYLTFVSLLMSHAGTETFVARQQRVQVRLPKEARLHIVRIRTMKKEITEAVRKRKEQVDAAKEGTEEAAAMEAGCASPEVEVVVSK